MSEDNILPFGKPNVGTGARRARARLSTVEARVAEVAEALADWQPPTSENINNPNLVNVRLAYLFVTGEFVRAKNAATKLDTEELESLLLSMTDTAAFFQGLSQLCALAVERVVAAAEGAE